MNMTLTKDPYSHSQFMVHTKMHYDTYKLMDFSVSGLYTKSIDRSWKAKIFEWKNLEWDP